MSIAINQPEYLAFEILVAHATPGGYPVTIRQSPAGDGEAFCQLHLDAEIQTILKEIEAGKIDPLFLSEFGGFLFNELFAGDIATLYRVSLGLARGQGKRVRVRLCIEPPELAALPWEYLFDVHESAYLATSAETALVRYVPMRLPARPTPVQWPLRVLAVIANPHDLQVLNVEQEKRILQEALAQWMAQKQVELQIVDHATLDNINQAMRTFCPHVFHFVGHGLFEQGPAGQEKALIVLEDEQQCAYPVAEEVFREFFSGCQETRLAVLNACQTATLSSQRPLVGLAPRLLQRQLSGVVAMQHPISDASSLIFTREFYRSLALGYPVDAAISEARRGLYQAVGGQKPDWGTPVLFLRAKDGQLFQVEQPQPAHNALPKPPQPVKPPLVTGFVGRAQELAYFTAKLAAEHYVVLTGMAGIGKTALAAMLAQQVAVPAKVFWHSFHKEEDASTVIWKLAGFLAWHGQEELWRQLQSAQQGGGQPPQLELLLDYLSQQLVQQDYLLCLDDCQFMADDPILAHFLERSLPLLVNSPLRVIMTSRETLPFVPLGEAIVLSGLSLVDTQDLVTQRLPAQDTQAVALLHANTEGNAQFLTLAINALQRTRNPARLLECLAEVDNIERYLLHEVDAGLTNEERMLMGGVAVLFGYPASRSTLELVLHAGSVRRTLRALRDRHLLIVSGEEPDQTYSQHAIVRAFYYDTLAPDSRTQMHQRAGDYYAKTGGYLEAALHWHNAGQASAAVTVLYDHFSAIVNAGQSKALYDLQQKFGKHELDATTWARLKLLAGRAASLVADLPTALAELDEALHTDDPYTKAQVLYYRAKTAENVNVAKARCDFQCGIELLNALPVEAKCNELLADLHIGLAWLYIQESPDLVLAENHLGQAQAVIDNRDFRRLATLFNAWSGLRSRQQNSPGTLDYLQRAWAAAQVAQDHELMIKIAHNLGQEYVELGQFEIGVGYLQQARTQAAAIGDRQREGKCYHAIGTGYALQAQYDQAIQYYQMAYTTCQLTGNRNWLGWVCHDLADAYSQSGNTAAALDYFRQAILLSRQLGACDLETALVALTEEHAVLIQQNEADESSFVYS